MTHTDPEHCADMIRRGYGCVCGAPSPRALRLAEKIMQNVHLNDQTTQAALTSWATVIDAEFPAYDEALTALESATRCKFDGWGICYKCYSLAKAALAKAKP